VALDRALETKPPKHASLDDIEHVVILMQENRSFDQYFGTLRGVAGFADPHVKTNHGRPVWDQVDPDIAANPRGRLFPFHLDTTKTSGQAVADQSHAWATQQASWNRGAMNRFVAARRSVHGYAPAVGAFCMGYYNRRDIPFHYALADAFTVCDRYHSSVLGPTNPNRIMSLSGTADASGTRGGPVVDNRRHDGELHWTSYPERLEAAGITWFVYQEADNDNNNMLPFFAGVNSAPRGSSLARRANTVIPTPPGAQPGPSLVARLRADVLADRLPQVSWVLASTHHCEHPPATPGAGAQFIGWVLQALTAKESVWAKTLLVLTYDENDGFFDHVEPPIAPPTARDEYVDDATAFKFAPRTHGVSGPIGLGFRVPTVLISPFTQGGTVCSDTFDHTSILQFLERRFGVAEPNISSWRRHTVGDLVSAVGCGSQPNYSFPKLPDPNALAKRAAAEVARLAAPKVPKTQRLPAQEAGTRPVVGNGCH
jgi:phospholipase C